MSVRKRGLRPIETLSKKERETLYASTKAEVNNHHYTSQTTRLLKKEKKEREIEEQLQNKRKEIEDKAAVIDEQHRVFEDRQKEMREKIDRKEPTIMMYDKKIKQETEKLKREEELIKLKTEELKRTQEEEKKVDSKLEAINSKIKKYKAYKNFLEEVVTQSEDYEDIQQLMSRYWTLKQNAHNLETYSRTVEEAMQLEKETFAKSIKQKKDEIAMNTGIVNKLENSIELTNAEINQLEAQQEVKFKKVIKKKGATGKVLLSIKNIYDKVVKSKQIGSDKAEPARETSNYVSMLQKISSRLEDLKEITYGI